MEKIQQSRNEFQYLKDTLGEWCLALLKTPQGVFNPPPSLFLQGDQLELTVQTLTSDLERQSRSLESSRRREEELEAELREATLEAESLARARDQALLEASRLEQEKEACQSELDGQRKQGRQRERETGRLRQQLESTTLALEHSNQRACAQDSERRCVQS